MSLLGRRIGNYEIRAKIGEGGMGTVWLGEHPLIGKRVAIKLLLEELVAKEEVVSRFFHEAKAVNDIGHLNIVDIVDFGKLPGERGQELVYFVMEYLDGEALSTRIRRAGLPFKDTLHIIGQCCSALAASHKKGIVHRDLKPENIYLVARGGDANFVKLLDFGIAKLTGDSGTSSHKTRTGLVIGTPTYMSPEQCEGKGHIDHRSDVYSLGIVMYELLTGVVPFPGEGFGEVLVAHLTKPPAPPSSVNPNVPAALEAIVLHAIEKDRNRRFQTMEEFAAAIADPEAHLASWAPLPGHAGPTAVMPVAQPEAAAKSGRTLSLDDIGPTAVGGPPRPTTLEGAAAEVTLPEARRPGRRTSLVAIAAAATALVAVGGWLALSRSKGDDKPAGEAAAVAPAPAPAAARADDEVTVTIASDPPGAKVYRADKSEAERERTPLSFTLKRGAPPFDVQLRLDGYTSQTRTITSDASAKIVVSLARLPTATPAAVPTPVAPARAVPSHVSNVAKPHHEHNKKAPAKDTAPDDDGILKPNWK